MQNSLFPLRIATGNSFCNRTLEREKIKSNLLVGHHLWLEAHRRHGKSSLLEQVEADFKDAKEAVAMHRLDLAFCVEKDDIIITLCNGALDLMSKLVQIANNDPSSIYQALQNHLTQHFVNFSLSITLERGMPTGRFYAKPSLEMLKKTLLTLDKMAQENNHRVVYVIDEFQQIGKNANTKPKSPDHSIEGTVRHCLELATNTNYIFCGSEISLMREAMEDKRRPLYNHTVKIPIGRISQTSYRKHIGPLWEQNWEAPMNEDVFETIMTLSQRHPYYVNALCSQLWLLNKAPNAEQTLSQWEELVDLEHNNLKKDVLKLTKNQLLMLKALGVEPSSEPTGISFTKRVAIPIGSILGTLEQLIEKDIVYKKDGTYFVINPALAYLAARR